MDEGQGGRGEHEGAPGPTLRAWRLLTAIALCTVGVLWMWRHDSGSDSPSGEPVHLDTSENFRVEEAVDPTDPIGSTEGAENRPETPWQPAGLESGSDPAELSAQVSETVNAVDHSSGTTQPNPVLHGKEANLSAEDASLSEVVEPPTKKTAQKIPALKESPTKGLFTDVTAEAGIRFDYRNGASGDKLLPETMGGGVAFVDLLDDDGDPDLLFVGGSSWSAFEGKELEPATSLGLFRNDGMGRFEDVTSESGLDVTLYGMGPAVGDIDGDHDLDLFVAAVGGHRLFRNDDGFFVDITVSAGLAGTPEPSSEDSSDPPELAVPWPTGATFFDADRDGDLDLFVCHYVAWSPTIERKLDFRLDGIGKAYAPPQEYLGVQSQLFLNEGGRFRDVSRELGIWVPDDPSAEPLGKALAVKPTDIDGNGWTDLWVANDTTRNFLFRNLGGGQGFEEVGEWVGLAYDSDGRATGSMGLDTTFPKGTAEPVLLVGNYAEEMSSLYRGDGSGEFFTDESAALGLGPASREALTFAAIFFDVDLDGFPDLLQANGHVETEIAKLDPSQTYRQPAQLFWGSESGKLSLSDPAVLGDLSLPKAGRGAAFADMDADGDLDVVLTEPHGRPTLLRNELDRAESLVGGRQAGHWIRLRLRAPGPNSWALGARIEVTTSEGWWIQELTPTRGYLSQSEMAMTFGLGDASHVKEVKILWPDATEQVVSGLAVDQSHTVHHPLLKGNSAR